MSKQTELAASVLEQSRVKDQLLYETRMSRNLKVERLKRRALRYGLQMLFRKIPKVSLQTDSQKIFSGTQQLLDREGGLAGYNLDVVKKLATGLGMSKSHVGGGSSVVEFGAGTGTLAEVWRSEFGIDPICIEIDPELIKILKAKGFITSESTGNISSEISFIYTSNVLEHIEDDVNALIKIRERMQQGGKIAIYVPAFPMLFSDHDRSVGHFRRYEKKELVHKVKIAGFEIEKCFYNDCIGFLVSLSLRLFGYKNKLGLGSKKSLLFYDEYVYPVSKILDRIVFKHVIGKNLFLFAVNPKLG